MTFGKHLAYFEFACIIKVIYRLAKILDASYDDLYNPAASFAFARDMVEW